MLVFRPKTWTAIGAALALAGCGEGAGGEAGKAGGAVGEGEGAATAPAAAPGGEGEGGEGEAGGGVGEAGASDAYAQVPAESRTALRLAHLKGFFLAAQAAGPVEGEEAAAALVGQGMLEVFDPEAQTFRRAGVDETALRAAATSGDPARIRTAIASLDAASAKAGGDPAAVARGMTDIAAGLYRGVFVDGDGVDPIEYQHAYGAALAARSLAESRRELAPAKAELDKLVAMWPSPVAPENPAALKSAAQVQAQASRVGLALSGL